MAEEIKSTLDDCKVQKYVGMRRMIGERLKASVQNAPHIYQTVEVKMDNCFKFRSDLNKKLADQGMKVSFNDIIVKAVAHAVQEFPQVNSAVIDEEKVIKTYASINIGVATDTERGLVVPVCKDCGNKGLVEIAKTTKELVAKAREGKLSMEDMKEGTLTVSNLGAYDIENFTSIINSPEGCIISIASIKDRAVVEDGQIVVRKTMYMTLGADHRVIDGGTGIKFINCVKSFLENPDRIAL